MKSTITTERLVLRPYEPLDLESFVALVTDPEVMRFVGDGVATRERALEIFGKVPGVYERDAFCVWAVCDREDGRYVGSAEIKPRPGADDWEIVYLLARPYWGRGYATEIARAVIEHGFRELKLHRVSATVDPANDPSIRILEKVGMRRIDEMSDEMGPIFVYAADAGPA